MQFFNQYKKPSLQRAGLLKGRGFTLVELLVVIIIMSLITLTFLNRQGKFDSSTLMRSVAYSLALSVRQAQVYGVSVRPSTPAYGTFSAAHGLHFSNAAPNTPTKYLLFADQDEDKKYSAADTIDQIFTINGGFTIAEFCGVDSANSRYCSTGVDDTTLVARVDELNIIFVRPDPDAQIYAYFGGTPVVSGGVTVQFTSAYIKLVATNGDSRFVAVTNTGQASVCAPNVTLATILTSGC